MFLSVYDTATKSETRVCDRDQGRLISWDMSSSYNFMERVEDEIVIYLMGNLDTNRIIINKLNNAFTRIDTKFGYKCYLLFSPTADNSLSSHYRTRLYKADVKLDEDFWSGKFYTGKITKIYVRIIRDGFFEDELTDLRFSFPGGGVGDHSAANIINKFDYIDASKCQVMFDKSIIKGDCPTPIYYEGTNFNTGNKVANIYMSTEYGDRSIHYKPVIDAGAYSSANSPALTSTSGQYSNNTLYTFTCQETNPFLANWQFGTNIQNMSGLYRVILNLAWQNKTYIYYKMSLKYYATTVYETRWVKNHHLNRHIDFGTFKIPTNDYNYDNNPSNDAFSLELQLKNPNSYTGDLSTSIDNIFVMPAENHTVIRSDSGYYLPQNALMLYDGEINKGYMSWNSTGYINKTVGSHYQTYGTELLLYPDQHNTFTIMFTDSLSIIKSSYSMFTRFLYRPRFKTI